MAATQALRPAGPIQPAAAFLLRVTDVSVRFGGLAALSEVSFDIARQGEGVIGLIGPNGAGKSTLFNVISGLARPTAGHVWIDGNDVSSARGDRIMRKGLSRTFQGVSLAGGLTVGDNARLGLHTSRGGRGSERTRAKVDAALSRLGLRGYEHRYPGSLTYGERKRVELARVLLSQPRLLLLDEPFAGLSSGEVDLLYQLITDLSSDGVQVVLVEHDMSVVMSLCARLLVLSSGWLIADGSPSAVRNDPQVIEAYLGAE